MKHIRDKDLAAAVLSDLKLTCSCINQKILETANEQLRQSYLNILNETYNEHKQVFDMMHQRGWYKTIPARQQEISQFSNSISTMQNDIMQTIHTGGQQQQQQDIPGYNYNNNYQGNTGQSGYQWQQSY